MFLSIKRNCGRGTLDILKSKVLDYQTVHIDDSTDFNEKLHKCFSIFSMGRVVKLVLQYLLNIVEILGELKL